MRFLDLVTSAMRLNRWPGSKRAVHGTAPLGRGVLFSGVLCSGCCIAFSIAAVVTSQIAFSRVGRGNHFGLSQDPFYAMSGWAYLGYDLLHIFVVGLFGLWLVRSLCWEAWIGATALIVSACADAGSLSVNMFLQMPALNALANEKSAGLPHPEAGYDLICSTLDFAQGTFSLVGSFFLGAAALKVGKAARLAAWFMLLGFVTSALQIAEVGVHTGWTAFLDDWLTPGTEILQQTGIAACFWGLFRLSGPESRVKGNPAQGEAVGRTV